MFVIQKASAVRVGLALALLFLAIFGAQPVAAKGPSTDCTNVPISSGYAATDSAHGTTVTIGTPVTGYGCVTTAQAAIDGIVAVRFLWHNAGGVVIYSDMVTFSTTVTNTVTKGNPSVLSFSDVEAPNSAGDWGVQTLFCNSTVASQCVQGGAAVKADVKEDTKAKSFLVSSEVPIIGTALMGAAMIGAFLLYTRSKGSPRQQTSSSLA